MEMQVVNEHDVQEVKTGRGYTKFLVQHKKGVRYGPTRAPKGAHLLRYVEGGHD